MQKVTWKFKQYKADPEKAWSEVMSLEEITPENVVNLAKDENSVIHDDFEWNDTVAGIKYRLLQAREMIRNFSFETVEKEEMKNLEKYKQYDDCANDVRAMYQSFVNFGFTEEQEFQILTITLNNSTKRTLFG